MCACIAVPPPEAPATHKHVGQGRKAAPAGGPIGTISGGSITPISGGPIPTKSGVRNPADFYFIMMPRRLPRFASGLSVFDFLKRTTWMSGDQAALGRIGPAAVTLAEAEGLGAHARSVAMRLE